MGQGKTYSCIGQGEKERAKKKDKFARYKMTALAWDKDKHICIYIYTVDKESNSVQEQTYMSDRQGERYCARKNDIFPR